MRKNYQEANYTKGGERVRGKTYLQTLNMHLRGLLGLFMYVKEGIPGCYLKHPDTEYLSTFFM